jgi:hypothetical protein
MVFSPDYALFIASLILSLVVLQDVEWRVFYKSSPSPGTGGDASLSDWFFLPVATTIAHSKRI